MSTTHFLSMPADELERAGAAWTAREIAQQPAVWRRFATSELEGTRRFLAPLLARREVQVVLTGAGSSAAVGECLLPALFRRIGTRARALATTDLVADPQSHLDASPLLLVSFARSGNSPESLAALDLASRVSGECHHLVITCNQEGELSRAGERHHAAHVLLLPDETNDRAFAMTSSFSTMMLAAALAFELLPSSSVAHLASWAEAVLGGARSILDGIGTAFDRVVYLGDRELRGLARESALKLMELTDGRIVAVSDTPLGFRHGPKTIINPRTLVIFLFSNDAYTRAYELDLYHELRREAVAARVLAVTTRREVPGEELVLPEAAPASDLELCFPYVMFAQCIALQSSLAHKRRPDSPNERGTVSRIVQGVSVHPWQAKV